jgi:hypothetical protein
VLSQQIEFGLFCGSGVEIMVGGYLKKIHRFSVQEQLAFEWFTKAKARAQSGQARNPTGAVRLLI